MVKNFIIKSITSFVKIQMLQQVVNTSLEKADTSSLPRFLPSFLPQSPRGLVLKVPYPHRVAGVSVGARQGEGCLPTGLSPQLQPRGECKPQCRWTDIYTWLLP